MDTDNQKGDPTECELCEKVEELTMGSSKGGSEDAENPVFCLRHISISTPDGQRLATVDPDGFYLFNCCFVREWSTWYYCASIHEFVALIKQEEYGRHLNRINRPFERNHEHMELTRARHPLTPGFYCFE
jgi:hypothetical protein